MVSNFDEDSKLDEFVVSSNYKNEKECIKYILKTLIDSLDGTSEEEKRSSFVDKYQSTIMYMFDMFGSLSSSTIELIKSEISSHVFDLLQKDSFYNLVKHYLDIDQGFEYDPEELRHHTDTIHDLLMNIIGLQTLAELMTGNGKRLISMHYPEVEYCLLKNYSE